MVTQEQFGQAFWRRSGLWDKQQQIAFRFADQELSRLRRKATEQLAMNRGWKISDWFGLRRLKGSHPLNGRRNSEYNDDLCCHYPAINARHTDFYTLEGRATAIVTHNYGYSDADNQRIEEFVERHKLHKEVLPWSWYSPQTTALLYTRAVASDADDFGDLL